MGLAAVGEFHPASPLLDGDAGKIRYLLTKTGEPVEESRLAGVGRTDDGDDRGRSGFRPSAYGRQHRNRRSAIVALAHSGSRNFRSAAVSRRKANSDPSTRYTRGSPPGAECAATIRAPGRNPNSISRNA